TTLLPMGGINKLRNQTRKLTVRKSLVVWLALGLLGWVNLDRTFGRSPDDELQELPGNEPGLEAGDGHAHFPITSRQRRTQLYFDQGLAMLHGFAPQAAQRSFQHALNLEPELPMPWFAMALATLDQPQQAAYFVRQAIRWRDSGTEREKA